MWYDLVCIAIIVFSIWRGMAKGFVSQLASIAGIVLCFLFAEAFSVVVAPMTGLEPPLSRWVSILVLYVISSFGAFALARMIQDGLQKAKFEDFDRHLGAIFGFVKGAVFCLVVSFFMFTLTETSRETVIHSRSGYASAVVLHQIDPIMPEGFHKLILPYMAGFDPDSIAQHLKDHPHHDHDHDHNHGHTPSQPGAPTAPPTSPFPGTSSPFPGNSSNPFNTVPQGNNSSSQVNNSGTTTELQKLLEQFTGGLTPEMRQIVHQTIEQATPAERPALLQQVSSSLPDLIRQMAEQATAPKSTQPAPAPLPAQPAQQDWKQHRATLLRNIAAIYTTHVDAQQSIMEEVVYSLHGLPDAITIRVLEDWHSDLRRLSPDPDPTTDMTTALDRRIMNQLNRANIPLSTLSAELRERLTITTRNYR